MNDRSKEFGKPLEKPVEVKDSRFGIHRMFLTSQEHPRIKVYMNAGRGPNGEHQS
jgi:hypothetical protein